jgi:hypothetical protein
MQMISHLASFGSKASFISSGLVLFAGCAAEATLPEENWPRYEVVSGACGVVAYAKSIGSDSASALRAVQVAESQQYGPEARLELTVLNVVDTDGGAPTARFYAVHVLSAESNIHLESVSQAITTEGDLYGLRWCDD